MLEKTRPAMLIAVLHLCVAMTGIAAATKGVFLPSLISGMGMSYTQASLMTSLAGLVNAATALTAGWLMQRQVGVQYILGGFSLFMVAGATLAGSAASYTQLLLAYILMGTPGICLATVPVVVSNWFPKRRGIVLGAIMAGSTLSGVVLVPLVAWIVSAAGWRMGYFAIAIAIAATLPAGLLLFVRSRPAAAEAKAATTHIRPVTTGEGRTLREAIRTPVFWLIFFAYMTYCAHTAGYYLHFVPALHEHGFTLVRASLIMAVGSVAAGLSKLICGYLGDRWHPRSALILVFSGSTIALSLFAFNSGPVAVWTFAALYGLTMSAPMILMPVLVEDMFGKRHFAAIDATISVVAMTLGGIVGQTFVGVMHDRTGSYDLAFRLLILLPAAGIVTLLFLRKPQATKTVLPDHPVSAAAAGIPKPTAFPQESYSNG